MRGTQTSKVLCLLELTNSVKCQKREGKREPSPFNHDETDFLARPYFRHLTELGSSHTGPRPSFFEVFAIRRISMTLDENW